MRGYLWPLLLVMTAMSPMILAQTLTLPADSDSTNTLDETSAVFNISDLFFLENETHSMSTQESISKFTTDSLFSNESSTVTRAKVAISEEDRRKCLQELQAQSTMIRIPAMTFILLLSSIGVFGNSLVLYVYSRKFALNGTRVFILSIAALDLITNIVLIPGEVYDMFHLWDFNNPWLCRIRLFGNALTTVLSAQLLSALAVARYRKVCVPFGWQISASRAKVIIAVLVFLTTLCAVPYGIINGKRTRETPHPDIFGHECTVDDAFVDTKWPLVNSAFFIFLYVGNSTIVVVMYSLVGVKASRHNKKMGQVPSGSAGSSNVTSDNPVLTNSTSSGNNAIAYPAPEEKELHTEKTAPTKKANPQVKISKSLKTVTFSRKGGPKKRSAFSEGDKDRKAVERGRGNEDPSGIEYFTDEDMADNQSEGARIIRSPISPQDHVNLSMVRELTVKLRAVQKQNSREEEQRGEREGQSSSKELTNKEDEDKALPKLKNEGKKEVTKYVHFKNPDSLQNDNVLGTYIDDTVPGERKSDRKRIRGQNVQTIRQQNAVPFSPTRDDLGTESQNNCNTAKNIHTAVKSVNDSDKQPSKLDLGKAMKIGSTLQCESGDLDDKEESMTDFARATQWIDICLQDDENKESELRATQEDAEKLSKSNSVSYSRKVSRDNSFLRKNRTFRDNLSDTLSRARKSKLLRKSSSVTALRDIPKQDDRKDQPRTNKNDTVIKPKRNLKNTTRMLITISAIYIIGFLPYLGLSIYYNLKKEEFKALEGVRLAVYNVFLRFYFLNTASNAVIYGIYDSMFRAQCVNVFRRKPC